MQVYDAALADFDKALELREADIDALIGRSRNLVLKGEADAGLTEIARALELVPDRADAYLVRALAHARSGQPDAAMEDILIGFGLDPESTSIAIAGASVLTELQEPLSAITVLEPILEADPNNAAALTKRAAATQLRATPKTH